MVRCAERVVLVRHDGAVLDVVVYTDVSTPYLDAGVRSALSRLRDDRDPLDRYRAGSMLAVASVRGTVVGCARALRSPADRPAGCSPGLRALGPDRYAEWLAGGLELTEVVVDVGHRRAGVGTALTGAVLTPAVRRRGWARTGGADVGRAGAWLRGRGWVPVAADRAGAGEVLLDPRHPALRDAGGPAPVPRAARRTAR